MSSSRSLNINLHPCQTKSSKPRIKEHNHKKHTQKNTQQKLHISFHVVIALEMKEPALGYLLS